MSPSYSARDGEVRSNVIAIVIFTAVSFNFITCQQPAPTKFSPAVAPAANAVTDWQEYCESEEFKPSCGPDHVIMMTEALYGRMKIGRCVKIDYGYVGCYADVLEHLDGVCSGRHSCSIRIPDASLDVSNTCPKEFKTYLNASYTCIEVEKLACQSCAWSNVARLTARRAYLSSAVTMTDSNGCGSIKCPWSIEVKTGQKINITLFDFSETKTTADSTPKKQQSCTRYGVIREKTASQDAIICSGQGRESRIYTSLSNSVEIQVVSPEVFTKTGHFLIYYEVLGCPDYNKPDNMWIRREDNKIRVGCLSSSEEWQLICKDHIWEGQIGTCPQDHKTENPASPGPQTNPVTLGIGLLTAIVLGIALVVGVLILTVGIVCLKRQQHGQRWRPPQYYYPTGGQYYYDYPEPLPPDVLEMHQRHKAFCSAAAAAAAAAADNRRIYLPVAGGPPITLGNSLRQNIYLRHMDSRPLPSIPSLTEESTSDDDVIRTQAIVHRANSTSVRGGETPYNRSLCSNPRSVSSQGSRNGDPQYFVLDADDPRRLAGGTAAAEEAGAAAAASPSSASASPRKKAADGHSSKDASVNSSCHEIPLRPSRDGLNAQNQNVANECNSGNCSWP